MQVGERWKNFMFVENVETLKKALTGLHAAIETGFPRKALTPYHST